LLIETERGGNASFRKMVWVHTEEEEPAEWQIGEMRPSTEMIAG
jgi:hypothetical protein